MTEFITENPISKIAFWVRGSDAVEAPRSRSNKQVTYKMFIQHV